MNEHVDPRESGESGEPRDDAVERELRDLPSPNADDAFRRRMREAFVAGSLEPASRSSRGARGARRSGAPRGLAVAATLLVAIGLGWFANRGPEVSLLEVSGEGLVTIDGNAIPVGDRAALAAALAPGATVEVPAGVTLAAAIPGVALLEAAAGTEVVLPGAYGRWWPTRARCEVRRGEVRFASGPEFAGRELEFTTPHGMARITGTVVSVMSDANGTCVCVLEGTALVGRDASDLSPIAVGSRMVLPAEGATSTSPVVPVHAQGIEAMFERVGDRFPR